jgi:hypothetical protein
MAPRKTSKQTHFQDISIHRNVNHRIHNQMNFRVWRTHAVHFPQEMDINTLQRYTLLLLKKTIFTHISVLDIELSYHTKLH